MGNIQTHAFWEEPRIRVHAWREFAMGLWKARRPSLLPALAFRPFVSTLSHVRHTTA